MTRLLRYRILDPTYAAQFAPSFPIQVNEDARTVRVQSGITQRILLDYLANYTCTPSIYLLTQTSRRKKQIIRCCTANHTL
jgi:hypothetical protein